jgi:hypothetical protein
MRKSAQRFSARIPLQIFATDHEDLGLVQPEILVIERTNPARSQVSHAAGPTATAILHKPHRRVHHGSSPTHPRFAQISLTCCFDEDIIPTLALCDPWRPLATLGLIQAAAFGGGG